jgi:hypothetical protein
MTATEALLLKNTFVEISKQEEIIVVRVLPQDFGDKDFDDYLAFLTDYWTRDVRSSFIIDISRGKYMSSDRRIKFGNLTKKYRKEMVTSVHCVAFVNTSVLAATVLKGILLISPLEIPTKVFTQFGDAEQWCHSLINKAK